MTDPERWLSSGEGGSEMTRMLRAAKGMSPTVTEKAALGARLEVATPGLWLTPAIKAIGVGAIAVGAVLGIREASQAPPPLGFTEDSSPRVSSVEPKVVLPTVSFGEASIDSPESQTETLKNSSPAVKKRRVPSEAALLKAARAQLGTDPKSARKLLNRHQELYPTGVLSQERELLKVRALQASGNASAARTQVKQFRKNHPDSVHHVPATTK